jgi:hypothetical protein
MKSLLTLCVLAVSAVGQEVVFRGTPTVRVYSTPEKDERQQLDQATAYKNECVITQRGKKYFWTSRDNVELRRVDAPQFTYFVHTGGGGYVKVLTGSRKATSAPADYIENVTSGFDVITYWGKVESTGTSTSR